MRQILKPIGHHSGWFPKVRCQYGFFQEIELFNIFGVLQKLENVNHEFQKNLLLNLGLVTCCILGPELNKKDDTRASCLI